MKKLNLLIIAGLITLSSFSFIACSADSQSDPKEVVISMFGAMEKDDKAALAHLLDLAELMRNYDQDYAFHSDEEPRMFTSPQQILDDLTGDGETKRRWFSLQRIINDVTIDGTTATVEVTFMDKATSKAYLTNFGLHFDNDKWKIFSFRAITSDS